ncbi:MAG: DUF1404 family protein [Conexivisphaerales archaeon]
MSQERRAETKGFGDRRSRFLMILGILVTFGIFSSPPFDSLTYTNLIANMVQHFGMLIFSAVFGYGFALLLKAKWGDLAEKRAWKYFYSLEEFNRRSRGLVISVVFPVIILTYWNLPWNFDLAATELPAHLLEHASYMLTGFLIGISIPAIPRKVRIVLLWIAFMQLGMMGSMMLVWQPGFYTAYSPYQNQLMNTIMMLVGAAGVSTTSVLLLREMDIV